MKNKYVTKLVLTLAVVFAVSFLNAQTTLMFQNFEASKTVAPAGWTQQLTASAPSNKGWNFGNKYPGVLAGYVPAHTYYAYVDDYDNNTSVVANNDTLRTPVINCTGQSHVFVSFDAMYYVYDGSENATVAVSADGGKTWATADTVPNNNFTWQDSLVFDISKWAGNQANVMVAFTYFDGVPNSYNSPGVGMAVDNVDVFAPLNYDLSVTAQYLPYLMLENTAYTFTGTIYNYGGDSINSLRLNYTVNGGPVQSDNVTGITKFTSLTNYTYTHNINFTPNAKGVDVVKIWADNLNGANVDQNHKNDTLTANFMVVDTLQPRQVMYEEVVGQSCVYCMLAAPNIDSVQAKNASICNTIHYHVPYPGPPDYMYDATSAIGTAVIKYYNVQGTPQGEIDGQSLYPGALGAPYDFSSYWIASEASVGSPFNIKITNCAYDPSTTTYSLSASIVCHAPFPAGLSAKVALVADSVTYSQDYSSDDPTASFAPPIGTSTGGSYPGAPDYLYPYVLTFPSVVEDMLPNTTGTALTAFTALVPQTINVSWKKNHLWSDSGKQYPYDSSRGMHMVVFLQSDKGIASVGIPAQYVVQSASSGVFNPTGIPEISKGVAFKMYPNPTSGSTSLMFELADEQNVNVAVYNLLGEQVYSDYLGKMSTGSHTYTINGEAFAPGVYMVRFITDNASTTQKLVIQR